MRSVTIFACLLAAWGLVASSPGSAGLIGLRDEASGTSSLVHHWTFEGASDAAQRQDKKGSAHLSRVTEGSGTAAGWALGFRGEGQAASTNRIDAQDGGAYESAGFNHPDSGTVEYLFNATDDQKLDGHYVSSQSASRMYMGLFWQSDVGVGFGDSSWPGPFEAYATDSTTPAFQAGHWYYVAVTYEFSTSPDQFIIDAYLSDLTEGQTTLTHAINGVTRQAPSGGPGSAPLGIGMQTAAGGQNYFQGYVDELAWYEETLPASTLQDHLDTIGVPEPTGFSIRIDGSTSRSCGTRTTMN
jgi:hypothetical protein